MRHFGLNQAQMRHHEFSTLHMHNPQPMMACPSGYMTQCHHKEACLSGHDKAHCVQQVLWHVLPSGMLVCSVKPHRVAGQEHKEACDSGGGTTSLLLNPPHHRVSSLHCGTTVQPWESWAPVQVCSLMSASL